MPRVLLLDSLSDMKVVRVLNPLSVRVAAVEVVTAALLPVPREVRYFLWEAWVVKVVVQDEDFRYLHCVQKSVSARFRKESGNPIPFLQPRALMIRRAHRQRAPAPERIGGQPRVTGDDVRAERFHIPSRLP